MYLDRFWKETYLQLDGAVKACDAAGITSRGCMPLCCTSLSLNAPVEPEGERQTTMVRPLRTGITMVDAAFRWLKYHSGALRRQLPADVPCHSRRGLPGTCPYPEHWSLTFSVCCSARRNQGRRHHPGEQGARDYLVATALLLRRRRRRLLLLVHLTSTCCLFGGRGVGDF